MKKGALIFFLVFGLIGCTGVQTNVRTDLSSVSAISFFDTVQEPTQTLTQLTATPTQTPWPTPTITPTPFQPLPTVTPTPEGGNRLVQDFTKVLKESEARTQTEVLLPDLRTLPPENLRLVVDPGSGRTYVRFSNMIWNSGPGRLELVGRINRAAAQIQVAQRVFSPDGEIVEEYGFGVFQFHDLHNHWHLDDFAIYEVWALDDEGEPDHVAATGGKVSYCVQDIRRGDETRAAVAGPNRPQFRSCWGEMQGLSPNWIDVYEFTLPGQYVDITGLPNGVYALITTVDPDDLIRELRDHNNAGQVFFELRDYRIRIVDPDAE
jgi:hypothetical protein